MRNSRTKNYLLSIICYGGRIRKKSGYFLTPIPNRERQSILLRKTVFLLTVLALFVLVVGVSAGGTNENPSEDGCFVDATDLPVNEGVDILVTVKCQNFATDNNLFGFQFGTALSGDYAAATAPVSYVPGQFTSTATGGVVPGVNTLALYGVSRKGADIVDEDDFTLGSYTLTADTDLTDADGTLGVTFLSTIFKLSDNLGAPITGWQRTDPDYTHTVNDIDLAWLSGDVTVQSNSTALNPIADVDLNVGGKHYTAASEAASLIVLTMNAASPYIEDASGNAAAVAVTRMPQLYRLTMQQPNTRTTNSVDRRYALICGVIWLAAPAASICLTPVHPKLWGVSSVRPVSLPS